MYLHVHVQHMYSSGCDRALPPPTGTTGEHIVLVGDSAGGNLAMTTAMKILEHGVCVLATYSSIPVYDGVPFRCVVLGVAEFLVVYTLCT